MFDLFLPVISKAGEYDERPLLETDGSVVAQISFALAEEYGLQYIKNHEQGDDMTLKIAVLRPTTMDESLKLHETWEPEENE